MFNLDKNSDKYKFIKLLNPLGEDLAVMRTSLIPSAVRAACYNITRKNFEGKLFEFAKEHLFIIDVCVLKLIFQVTDIPHQMYLFHNHILRGTYYLLF